MLSSITGILSIDMSFILESMTKIERHIIVQFVLKDYILKSLKGIVYSTSR